MKRLPKYLTLGVVFTMLSSCGAELPSLAVPSDNDNALQLKEYRQKIDADLDGNPDTERVVRYNRKGSMTEHIYYQNGVQTKRSVLVYNVDSNLVSSEHSANQSYSSSSEITYDTMRRKVRVESDLKNADHVIDKVEHYEYNATSMLPIKISEDDDADGQVDRHQAFTYQDDKPIARRWYQAGQLIRLERYSYNARGLLFEQTSYPSETAEYDSLGRYQYDSHDQLLTVTVFSSPSDTGLVTYQAFYNDASKPLSVTSFKNDGTIIKQSDYSYYPDGKLLSEAHERFVGDAYSKSQRYGYVQTAGRLNTYIEYDEDNDGNIDSFSEYEEHLTEKVNYYRAGLYPKAFIERYYDSANTLTSTVNYEYSYW